jgi:dipeptidyl aminopeptidase/acylaminoacyl peptidase
MKNAVLYFVFSFTAICCFSQKAYIDSNAYRAWTRVGNPSISNDGNYSMYSIIHSFQGMCTLVLRSLVSTWKMEIPVLGQSVYAKITADSKSAVFLKPKDTLCILTLSDTSIECIAGVKSFKLPVSSGRWLAYFRNTEKVLFVRDLISGKEKSFKNVNEYMFSSDGSFLFLQSEVKNDSCNLQSLQWVALDEDKVKIIWSNDEPFKYCKKTFNFTFDDSGRRLAFIEEEVFNNKSVFNLWYYQCDMDNAVKLANNHLVAIDRVSQKRRYSIQRFSKDGKRLFILLQDEEIPVAKTNTVKVDVWSYKDFKLQSQQVNEMKPKSYLAVVQISDPRFIQMEQDDEQVAFNSYTNYNDTYGLIIKRKSVIDEWNWNPFSRSSIYLLSTINGERKIIKENVVLLSSAFISPNEKYVIYFDSEEKNYFCYEISTGITRNITKGIYAFWNVYDDSPQSKYMSIGLAGWLNDDSAVLIYDQNDIWLVDPKAIKSPRNVTNGYGRRKNIVFRFPTIYLNSCFLSNEKIVLKAFNRSSKNEGFYSKTINNVGDPELLTMGPFKYVSLQKGRDSSKYLIMRMSATESPNYFYSSDFKSFTRLSSIQPEKEYNWLTAELITWKTFNGKTSQGILYKPENFNPKKKYPIIFYFYEKLSDDLNIFLFPEYGIGPLNIPTFVSNGYIVFTPDIHYVIGRPGESAFNSVVSAATYMSQKSWINSKKMAIQGHSFGGYEVNYIVTRTEMFASAASGAGVCNFISSYGGLRGQGQSRQGLYELTQSRMGASLWQRPDLYINNSPIFRANKVSTPMLLLHNRDDDAVPFSQGIEFFTALRRLRKKVWMLQYDGHDHILFPQSVAAADFNMRLKQFFDFYLKNAPAPLWMTQGIPANKRGIESGLQLDYSNKIP